MIDIQEASALIDFAKKFDVHYDVHPMHVATIMKYYDGDSKTISELEKVTRLPRWQVRNIAYRLGYRMGKDSVEWSPDERDFLIDQYGLVPIKSICRELKRSQKSVEQMAGRMGIHQLSNQGWFSATELAGILNICRDTVINWTRMGLECRRVRGDRAYLFEPQHMRNFFYSRPEAYDYMKLSLYKMSLLYLVKDGKGRPKQPPKEKQIVCQYFLRKKNRICGHSTWQQLYAAQQACPDCGRMMSKWAEAYRN